MLPCQAEDLLKINFAYRQNRRNSGVSPNLKPFIGGKNLKGMSESGVKLTSDEDNILRELDIRRMLHVIPTCVVLKAFYSETSQSCKIISTLNFMQNRS